MMSLFIDVGNTRVKVQSAQHNTAFSHNDLEQLLPWLLAHQLQPKKAWGVCVASKEITQKIGLLLQRLGCSIHWLDGSTPCQLLHNNYDAPQQLGADRWLGLIGVLTKNQTDRPIIYASFGTATTVDTILPATDTAKAQFIGGLILPGPTLMYDSLALNTAQLGQGVGAKQPFPTNTRSAISSGISAAQAGAVLQQWQLAWQKKQGAPLLVCSGGGWDLIKESLVKAHRQQLQLLNLEPETIRWQPTPVLDGLSYISNQIQNSKFKIKN